VGDPPNVAPLISLPLDILLATTPSTPLDIPVVANDPDSLPGTVFVLTSHQPTSGSLTHATSFYGAVYTPDEGFEGVDTFSLFVKDDQGASSNVLALSVEVRPPRIEVSQPVAADGVDLLMSADIGLPASSVASATLLYGEGTDVPAASTAFTHGAGDVWTATIPGGSVTMDGLLWYAEVVDTLGQTFLKNAATAPGHISVHGDVELPLATMAAPPNIWNGIGPPLSPDNSAMSAMLDTEDGGFLTEWFAWRWSAEYQRWEVAQALPDATPVTSDGFEVGKGWFVAALGKGGIETRTVRGQSVDPTTPYAIPIRPGWNLLANPYGLPVVWSDGVVQASIGNVVDDLSALSSLVDSRLIYLDVSTQSYVTHLSNASTPYSIPPGQAWWFLSNATGDLIIDPLASWAGQAAPALAPVPADDWWVTISAESALGRDSVEAAVSSWPESSRAGSLRHVRAPAPPGSRAPRLSIVDPNADGPLSLLTHSAESPKDRLSWVIELRHSGDVVLDWRAVGVPAAYDLILSDEESGRQISLNRDGHLRLEQNGQNSHRLILRATKRPIPAATALLPNFPNPFNPETWMPFDLSEESSVNIRIYNTRGERIRTLDLGRLPAGEYATSSSAGHWDGKNDVGEPVASGVYVYELTAGDYHAVRRMVVMK
jgi:hypothetical protein